MSGSQSYVGRQTSRSDGHARRAAILEATLALIASDGIRGVRHRAVANMAGVPLASTTYYFKDIKALIHDALVYFAERSMEHNIELKERAFAAVRSYTPESLRDKKSRDMLTNILARLICEHIQRQVFNIENRLLQLAFQEEALRNPQLAKVMIPMDDAVLGSLESFFAQLGSKAPMNEACQVLGLIRLLEYRYSVRRARVDMAECETLIRGMLEGLLLGLAR
ncbi:TetR/AcrR family transcriptional regulator [Shewanella cyperi]|uniref:TetR family transcriptional regulator n=1 Tax=Shewanella cyperi TaxID=2814292 RepID=A0A974XQP4_9GAMM|nr:TetR family transcriptional regulator [Shewanella cyperi]QSX28764.1 TetR family transcriptional regulator [Shewanella cyperi]QSX39512.1 TetR family transcriptional regulator [Shewanella cyperi]